MDCDYHNKFETNIIFFQIFVLDLLPSNFKDMTTINDIRAKVNSTILEQDPQTYYHNLKTARQDPENAAALRSVLNDSSEQETWNSSAILQLSYVCGDLVNPTPDLQGHTFWGQFTVVDDSLGCLILDEMILAGADPHLENFYEDSVLSSLKHTHTLTYRKHNEKFKKKIDDLFTNFALNNRAE